MFDCKECMFGIGNGLLFCGLFGELFIFVGEGDDRGCCVGFFRVFDYLWFVVFYDGNI